MGLINYWQLERSKGGVCSRFVRERERAYSTERQLRDYDNKPSYSTIPRQDRRMPYHILAIIARANLSLLLLSLSIAHHKAATTTTTTTGSCPLLATVAAARAVAG